MLTFHDYFTDDGWENEHKHLLSLSQGYKGIDKEETRWGCGQFIISFKIEKGLNSVQTFELQSNSEDKVFEP